MVNTDSKLRELEEAGDERSVGRRALFGLAVGSLAVLGFGVYKLVADKQPSVLANAAISLGAVGLFVAHQLSARPDMDENRPLDIKNFR
jgi:hypothetical protein